MRTPDDTPLIDESDAGDVHPSWLGVTKREFLRLAGLSSLGVLFGRSTAARTNPENSSDGEPKTEPPAQSPLTDTDGDGILEMPDHDGIEAEEYWHNPRVKEHNVVRRRLVSTENHEYYVDPEGDDDNDGSRDRPLASISEAFNRLPFILQHRVAIHLNEGRNTNVGGTATTCRAIVNPQAGHEFQIIGNREHPERVILDGPSHISFSLVGSPPLEAISILGVHVKGKLQNYAGALGVRDCILHSHSDPSISSVVGGYEGRTTLFNCEIGGDADYLIGASQFPELAFGHCSGEVNKAIVHAFGNASMATIRDLGNNTISAPQWLNEPNASVLTIRGSTEIGSRAGETWWKEN